MKTGSHTERRGVRAHLRKTRRGLVPVRKHGRRMTIAEYQRLLKQKESELAKLRGNTVQTYSFKELSKEVQEKVIERFRNDEDFPGLEDSVKEEILEQIKQHPEIRYAEGVKPMYSLGNSQGDGVMFEGVLGYRYKGKEYTLTIHQEGHYYHSKSKHIDVIETENNEYPDNADEVYEAFDKIYEDICRMAEKAGYAEMEYQTSDETIKENIEANDYRFLVDGRFSPR